MPASDPRPHVLSESHGLDDERRCCCRQDKLMYSYVYVSGKMWTLEGFFIPFRFSLSDFDGRVIMTWQNSAGVGDVLETALKRSEGLTHMVRNFRLQA